MKKIIATGNAPAAIGPYSQAIDCGSFLVTSGQVPFDPATGEFVPGGITEQTRQVLTNIKAILEAAYADHGQRGQDHRVPAEHGRFRRHERGVRRVLHRGSVPRPLRCGGRRSAPRRAGGDRDDLREVNSEKEPPKAGRP